MSNVINLKTVRRERMQQRAKAVTLCQTGLHKWKVLIDQQFDVKQGKLVTTELCERCQKQRTILK
jgi:hypothetical protein